MSSTLPSASFATDVNFKRSPTLACAVAGEMSTVLIFGGVAGAPTACARVIAGATIKEHIASATAPARNFSEICIRGPLYSAWNVCTRKCGDWRRLSIARENRLSHRFVALIDMRGGTKDY